MKRWIAFSAATLPLVSASLWAETFQSEYQALSKAGDQSKLHQLVTEAQEKEKENPDYYALASNYWWNFREVSITTKPPASGDLSVVDPATGKAVGSISAANPKTQQRALDLLVEGNKRFPHRIDIALGLATVQKELNQPDACLQTLKKIIKQATTNPEGLRSKKNQPLAAKANRYVPEELQAFTVWLYRIEDDQRCKALCEQIVAAFPDHPYAYNLLAALSSASGDKKATLSYLLTAHSKAPDDPLILLNIGDTYRSLGDIPKARETYELIKSSNADASSKAQAEKALQTLNESTPR